MWKLCILTAEDRRGKWDGERRMTKGGREKEEGLVKLRILIYVYEFFMPFGAIVFPLVWLPITVFICHFFFFHLPHSLIHSLVRSFAHRHEQNYTELLQTTVYVQILNNYAPFLPSDDCLLARNVLCRQFITYKFVLRRQLTKNKKKGLIIQASAIN